MTQLGSTGAPAAGQPRGGAESLPPDSRHQPQGNAHGAGPEDCRGPHRGDYRAEIDGLRALAVLLVIGHHLGSDHGFLPSGFLGVDIFFVISGYVITASIQRRGAQPLRPFLLGFYRRRLQRLAPALVLCVAVTGLLSCLVIPDPGPSLQTGAAALFGLSNLELHRQASDYFGTDSALNTFTQTWSLGVEEQFYLGYPLLAWGLGLARGAGQGRPQLFRLVLLLVVGLSLGWFLWLGSRNPGAAYLLTPGRLWELAAGALLVPLSRRVVNPGNPQPSRRPRSLRLPAWLPLAALLLLPLAPKQTIAFSTPLAVAATALLIPATATPGAVQRLLRTPWIRHLGLISYSLYLWHWSVISLSRWTIGLHAWTIPLQLLAMLALAEASYRFVEQPLRRRPWARSDGQTMLRGMAVMGALSGLLAWLALGAGGRHLYAGERTATVGEQLARQAVAGSRIRNPLCHLDADDQRRRAAIADLARDRSAPARAGLPTLFVAGDSHASALMPLESDLHAMGYGSIAHLSRGGCPFPATAYGNSKLGCAPFQRTWADSILANGRRGDAILIAGYHLSHLGTDIGDTRNHLLGADGRPITTAAGKLALYSEALRSFAAQAQDRGMEVLLLGAGPRLLNRDSCLPEWFRPERWNNRCGDALQQQIGDARQLNQQFARQLPSTITLIDPLPLFCPTGCRLGAMRQVLFDSDHPTAASVRRLQPLIRRMLARPAGPGGKRPRQTGPERTSP
ncbi:MAG: acyltransferase family protein [Cyanobium sp.]